MQYQEVQVSKAAGWRIFEEIRLPGGSLPSGHKLEESDIIALKQAGITHVFAALFDDKDIDAATALAILAGKICGANLAYSLNGSGNCKIVAAADGCFVASEERVAKFNRLSPLMLINTIPPYTIVKKGDVVAWLELTVPGLPQAQADDFLLRLSGNVELLAVQDLLPLKVGIVYSKFYNSVEETKHFTSVIRRLLDNFKAFNLDFSHEYNSLHNVEDLTDSIDRALRDDNDVVFVLGGMPNRHPQDIIPSALRHLVDDIANLNLPQAGVSDLILAQKKNKKIISLPFHYDEAETEIIDRLVKETLLCEKLSAFDLTHLHNKQLKPEMKLTEDEKQNLIISKNSRRKGKKGNIAAIVLAAGIGSRAGRNKLMVEMENGKPLFMKAVEAALKSDASPVYVITGYNADAMEDYLDEVDVNVIYNPSFRSGIKTSIALGIKALPSFCDGALLLPADMPNITAADLNKLIGTFDASEEKQLCLMLKNGIKHNPVIWSKSLFSQADVVAENADIRHVFLEHVDYTKTCELKDAGHLLDVNYPSDVDIILKN